MMFGKRSGENPPRPSLPSPGPAESSPGIPPQDVPRPDMPLAARPGSIPPAAPTGQLPPVSPAVRQAATAQSITGSLEPKTALRKSDSYYDIKSTIFNALIDAIDLTQLAQIDRGAAREEIKDIVNEIITLKDVVLWSA